VSFDVEEGDVGELAGSTVRCTEAGLGVREGVLPEGVEEERDQDLTVTEDLYRSADVVDTVEH
jgi:hypothetical protein